MTQVLIDKDKFVAALKLLSEIRIDPVPSPAAPIVVAPAETKVMLETPAFGAKPKLAWGAKVSQVFRDRVFWIADEITKAQGATFDPNWLMACMAWESGESFMPDKKNMAGSGATGLIQFMPSTAKELGEFRGTTLTTAALAEMTAEDQLTWVYWYFRLQIKRHGAITNLEDCYMAILWPGAIGSLVSTPLWTKVKMPTTYKQNAGLDSNKDGTITKAEAAGHVREKLTKGMAVAA